MFVKLSVEPQTSNLWQLLVYRYSRIAWTKQIRDTDTNRYGVLITIPHLRVPMGFNNKNDVYICLNILYLFDIL